MQTYLWSYELKIANGIEIAAQAYVSTYVRQ